MTTVPLITMGRTALAMAVLAPAAAGAKPADQATASRHDAVATAAGVSLSTFVSRHERRMLADDTDGDGKVSRAEFLAAAKAGKGDPAKRFAKLDTNGDGLLDRAEIDTMQVRRFKRLDTNGDGMLSAGERAVANARKANNAGSNPES